MDIINTILGYLDSIPAIIVGILAVVSTANAITVLTPTPKDDAILEGIQKYGAQVLKFVNMLAMNFGKNKNADAVAEPKPEDDGTGAAEAGAG